jgi:hypothetical protein
MRFMFACLSVYYRYSQEDESSLYPCLSIVDIYSLLRVFTIKYAQAASPPFHCFASQKNFDNIKVTNI